MPSMSERERGRAALLGVTMDDEACFAPDYGSARRRVLKASEAAATRHAIYRNPRTGPEGEPLAVDALWFGREDAANVLVLVSGTHGVEGFCGSGAQMDWLLTGGPVALPENTAALIVHALNPYGYAWLRRTTEEGVDLNRNGLDFDAALPVNPGYEALADALVPKSLDEATLAEAAARIARFRAEHGERAFETARSTGQHTHPEGIFYGGVAPTWCRHTMSEIASDFALGRRRQVAIVDYHTGLGSFGHGEPICGHKPGESGQARCRAWYGESLGEPLLGTSASLPIAGLTQYAWAREIGADRLTFIALEFGTYAQHVGATALRDDHWLHAYGAVDWRDPQTRAIKAALRAFYHPDTRDWRIAVLLRSRHVLSQAVAGLLA